jgi:chromosomal replication initiator protein
MHSTEKIENAIENDSILAEQVQKIREELSNG